MSELYENSAMIQDNKVVTLEQLQKARGAISSNANQYGEIVAAWMLRAILDELIERRSATASLENLPERPPHDAGVETWLWYERTSKRIYQTELERVRLCASPPAPPGTPREPTITIADNSRADSYAGFLSSSYHLSNYQRKQLAQEFAAHRSPTPASSKEST